MLEPPVARRLVLVAAAVVTLEVAGLVVLAALDLRDTTSQRLGSGLGVAVIVLAYGAAQVFAIVLLLRGVAAARSPLVVTQVLQVLVATGFRDRPGVALALALPAVLVVACLLSPPVNRALRPPPPV